MGLVHSATAPSAFADSRDWLLSEGGPSLPAVLPRPTCFLLFQTQQLGARGKYPGSTAAPGLPEEVRKLQHAWERGGRWGTVARQAVTQGGAGLPGVLGLRQGPMAGVTGVSGAISMVVKVG